MHEGGGGDYVKYLKRRWNKEEVRGNKDFKKGSRGGCLKKRGAGTPLGTMITLIMICINAGCTSSAGDIPLLVSLIFYI